MIYNMRIALLALGVLASPAHGSSHLSRRSDVPEWHPPPSGSVRGPCPMLNTLANHGYIPRTGQAITKNDTIGALDAALNIEPGLGDFLFQAALSTNPAANATTFDLSHLTRHNVLEHDASLSRRDTFFGDAGLFDLATYNETRSYWTDTLITVQMAANARLARVKTSVATNPTFTLSETGRDFSYGESGAYILIFGDRENGTAPRSWVEYFFENERLPVELGWQRQAKVLAFPDLNDILDRLVNATGNGKAITRALRRTGDLHGGRRPLVRAGPILASET